MSEQLWAAVASGTLALAVALVIPPVRARPFLLTPDPARERRADELEGVLSRYRAAVSAFAGCAGVTLIGGVWGWLAAVLLAVAVWRAIGRLEPLAARRQRTEVEAQLPHLVSLLAVALRSGSDPATGLGVVARAVGGSIREATAPVLAQLELGADPAIAWLDLAHSVGLEPLGRRLKTAHETGAPVAVSIEALATELAHERRQRAEDAARTVGVRAAVPLGLCLLPAFLLIGVVPVVAGLLGTIA